MSNISNSFLNSNHDSNGNANQKIKISKLDFFNTTEKNYDDRLTTAQTLSYLTELEKNEKITVHNDEELGNSNIKNKFEKFKNNQYHRVSNINISPRSIDLKEDTLNQKCAQNNFQNYNNKNNIDNQISSCINIFKPKTTKFSIFETRIVSKIPKKVPNEDFLVKINLIFIILIC